ncbi:hypothetical protein MPRG_31970 [Mycobacterium paragordonae]|uniref:Diacylglycerol O-acyltransferase n=1 Tax=Mycobacterium paragordonae TaxID=1389713 RepID=A0ABQ1C6I8_9MYCO|nr:hypothetical protein MPRG_31970 [Mycobacterium paragordonae]
MLFDVLFVHRLYKAMAAKPALNMLAAALPGHLSLSVSAHWVKRPNFREMLRIEFKNPIAGGRSDPVVITGGARCAALRASFRSWVAAL